MKPGLFSRSLLLLALAVPLLSQCTSTHKTARQQPESALGKSKSKAGASAQTAATDTATDSLDDYGDAGNVSDPFEPVNRATFAFNDKLYAYLFRPISKGYVAVVPLPLRKGLDNVFDNAKFPIRVINCGLQGKFRRAGLETKKFTVNTLAGIGGLIRASDKVPELAALPAEDTGQTLGKWGMGHGPYIVVPVLGPLTARDTLGYAGDYALNPTHWAQFFRNPSDAWLWIPPSVDTVRSLPGQLEYYDNARANAVDPYISVRSVYLQNRNSATND